MTTTFPTNSPFSCNTGNGYATPASVGGVPFNGLTPATYAGTTVGFAYPGFPNNGYGNGFGTGYGTPTFNPSTFNTPGFTPNQFYPSNYQWPQFGQWPQFSNGSTYGNWINPNFRAPGFTGTSGFAPAPFTGGFGYPAFNSVPSFNTWPSSNWNSPGSFPQNGFTPNFGGYTPGFVTPFPSFDSSIYTNGFGGFPAWNWQQNYSTPFSTFNPAAPYGSNTPFNFAQNFGFGVPSFGAFPWTTGSTQPFPWSGVPYVGPSNFGGQFTYGPFNGAYPQPFNGAHPQPFNGAYPQPFNGQYTNGQYVNGITPTGNPIPGPCNGMGLNREAA